MLTDYIKEQLKKAHYKILKDGRYFGSIASAKGVWASAKTLEDCRIKLQEVLEEWIALKLSSGARISGLSPSVPRHSHPIPHLYA